jgi:hypothetical protein
MVTEESQAPSNRRRESFQSGHGCTGAASRLGTQDLGGIVGRDFVRVEEASTLLIGHHYRTRARRYLGCIGAIFENNSVNQRPSTRGQPLCRGVIAG